MVSLQQWAAAGKVLVKSIRSADGVPWQCRWQKSHHCPGSSRKQVQL
jgi:hypothetical protein